MKGRGIRNAEDATGKIKHTIFVMKTAQVVSGFLLGTSLVLPAHFANALVVFGDGAEHTINDISFMLDTIEVRNGSTLRLEEGAAIGGPLEQLGTITVYDTSILEIAGAQLGSAGSSSGSILLFGESRLVVESGTLGADGNSSGHVNAFEQSSVVVLGGTMGGAGAMSGSIALFDNSTSEIRGGQFGGSGLDAGLFVAFGESQTFVFACDTGLAEGPLLDSQGLIIGETTEGDPFLLEFERGSRAAISLVEECDGGSDTDTDGDGVPDPIDLCPESDLRPNVWVFDIETRIENVIGGQPVNGDGCSLADLINGMIQDAADHSDTRHEFLRGVIVGLRDFQWEGLLPYRFYRHFIFCAARAHYKSDDDRQHPSFLPGRLR